MVASGRIFTAGLLAIFIGVGGFLLWKVKEADRHQAQKVLAQEVNKALSVMMADLAAARAGSLQGVPPDGSWNHDMAFLQSTTGPVRYHVMDGRLQRTAQGKTHVIAEHFQRLDLRRQNVDPLLLQVRVHLVNATSLSSSFNIRLRE